MKLRFFIAVKAVLQPPNVIRIEPDTVRESYQLLRKILNRIRAMQSLIGYRSHISDKSDRIFSGVGKANIWFASARKRYFMENSTDPIEAVKETDFPACREAFAAHSI